MSHSARLALAALGMLGLAGLGGCKNPDDGPTPFVMPAYPIRNLPPLPPNANPDTATKGPIRWQPGPPRRDPAAPTAPAAPAAPVPEPPRPLSPAPDTPPPARPVPLEPVPRAPGSAERAP